MSSWQDVKEHAKKARSHRDENQAKDVGILADYNTLGRTFGAGIGLYFRIVGWLRNLFLLMAITSVPYIIIINTSKFTDKLHTNDASNGYGYTVYEGFNLFSMTFAAILDDSKDNGTLPYMSFHLEDVTLKGYISKANFLIGMSSVDTLSAAGFLVCAVVFSFLAEQFISMVNEETVEVSDYTVVVKGLPDDANPVEIGDHFEQFGQVMDVVLVKDCGQLLQYSAQVTTLAKERQEAAQRSASANGTVLITGRVREAEEQLQSTFEKIDHAMEQQDYRIKAAFVTFNSEADRFFCQEVSPKSWFSCLFMRRQDRFRPQQDGGYRFWVEQALPPEDYIYEHLSVSRPRKMMRRVFSRAVVFLILLSTATILSQLQAFDKRQQAKLEWKGNTIYQDIIIGRSFDPGNNVTMGAASYCSLALPSMCSRWLTSAVNTTVEVAYGSPVRYPVLSEGLMKNSEVFSLLLQAATTSSGSSSSPYQHCLPCYCLGLAGPAASERGETLSSFKKQCGHYVESFGVASILIRIGISAVILVLNTVLKTVIEVLVKIEKHWTRSDEEWALALLGFVAQLLNSVLVLVMVNTNVKGVQSPTENVGITFLTGAYNDFNKGWYEDVGFSVMTLLMLNTVVPSLVTMAKKALQLLQRCFMLCVLQPTSQDKYNAVYLGWDFVLSNRVSDIMLNAWIALMFGSGMPFLYIVAFAVFALRELKERRELMRHCRQPVKYGARLPRLIIGMLPYAVVCHCAVGAWMHTHFATDFQEQLASTAAMSTLSNSAYFSRVFQSNGLGLLLLFILLTFYLVVIKWLLYGVLGGTIERCCHCDLLSLIFGGAPCGKYSYEEALSAQPCLLTGAATYRLPHHPRYRDSFTNPLYKPLLFRVFGQQRYTRLISTDDRVDTFRVADELIVQQDAADLEEQLSSMPSELQLAVRKVSTTQPMYMDWQLLAGLEQEDEPEDGAGAQVLPGAASPAEDQPEVVQVVVQPSQRALSSPLGGGSNRVAPSPW